MIDIGAVLLRSPKFENAVYFQFVDWNNDGANEV
jgi:hypothetical protein